MIQKILALLGIVIYGGAEGRLGLVLGLSPIWGTLVFLLWLEAFTGGSGGSIRSSGGGSSLDVDYDCDGGWGDA